MHAVVDTYQLLPHPEGGYFREVYRSDDVVGTLRGERSALTSIYYCLTKGDVSKFHKLLSDEIWYWQEGGVSVLHVRTPQGVTEHRRCGPLTMNAQPCVILKRGEWFCATIEPLTEYSLVGAAVAPGFDFADFTMAKRSVLVLCTGNTCRSQIAEGYLNSLPGVVALSAGVKAEDVVNPRAIEVMSEIGIDVLLQRPKTVESMIGLPFTDIITVCDHAAETCPVFPGNVRRHHLPVPDPAHAIGTKEELHAVFQQTRDELIMKLNVWLQNT